MSNTNAATTLYVKVMDPINGTVGFLPAVPAALPDSALRFARGRPLPAPPKETKR